MWSEVKAQALVYCFKTTQKEDLRFHIQESGVDIDMVIKCTVPTHLFLVLRYRKCADTEQEHPFLFFFSFFFEVGRNFSETPQKHIQTNPYSLVHAY